MSQSKKIQGNRDMALAFQQLRRSSAAAPHRNKARYDRNEAKRQMRKEL